MKILHSFSGGIDSTSVLYQLINSGHDVTVFHIDLISRSLRYQAERIAVEKIIYWFKNKGHKINVIDGGSTSVTGKWYDIEVCALHIGNHLRGNKSFDTTTESTSLTDKESVGWQKRSTNRVKITELIADRELLWLRLNENKNRSDVIKEMPDDLLNLTHFCRMPSLQGDKYVNCSRCVTCRNTLPYIKNNSR